LTVTDPWHTFDVMPKINCYTMKYKSTLPIIILSIILTACASTQDSGGDVKNAFRITNSSEYQIQVTIGEDLQYHIKSKDTLYIPINSIPKGKILLSIFYRLKGEYIKTFESSTKPHSGMMFHIQRDENRHVKVVRKRIVPPK